MVLKTNLFLICTFLAGLSLAGQEVEADSSKIEFSITKLKKHEVNGSISGMKGTVEFKHDFLVKIDICVDPATINTQNKRRDAHLRNEDYFDVKNYPSICFVSDSILHLNDSVKVYGNLTMLGTTRNEVVVLQYSKTEIHGSMKIDRYLYDLGDEGNYKIGREVKIEIYCVLEEED